MLERKFICNNKLGSSSKIKTEYIEEHILLKAPLTKLKSKTEAYKINHKVEMQLIIDNNSILISKSTYDELKQNISIGSVEYFRYYHVVDGINLILDVYSLPAYMMIITVQFENENDYNDFIVPNWFGKEVTDDDKYTNESLSV